jgi:RNA polymerase sigma factor (sigma-70 family)
MAMRDSEVVAAIVAGDPAGLAAAYDKYAPPLYSYCRSRLREPADAADAVQDTFVIAASRLSALRDPERLRPWLYAVARNECHRRLRGGSAQAPLEEAPDVTDESANVPLDAERAELRTLVSSALDGVGPAEREALELQLRQGLDGGEVAAVLGVTRNHAHALLSRARDQLHTALGVLLVARSGRQDCPGLQTLLLDWDGRLTVLMRKRVNRHVERCDICSARRRRELAPTAFLGIVPIAALPLAAASLPAGLRDHVLKAAPGASAHHVNLLRNGFPRPLHPPKPVWWHPRPLHAGAAVAGAAGLAVVVTVIAAPPPHHGALPNPGGPAVTVSLGGATVSPGVSDTAGTTAGGAATSDRASPTASRTTSTAPASSSASAPAPAPASAAAGTLTVSPATLDLVPPASGTITLAASGGPVNWSVREPPGLTGKLVVSPMSGTLAAGANTTVTVTMEGKGKPHVHLVFSPGGTTVTVVVE